MTNKRQEMPDKTLEEIQSFLKLAEDFNPLFEQADNLYKHFSSGDYIVVRKDLCVRKEEVNQLWTDILAMEHMDDNDQFTYNDACQQIREKVLRILNGETDE